MEYNGRVVLIDTTQTFASKQSESRFAGWTRSCTRTRTPTTFLGSMTSARLASAIGQTRVHLCASRSGGVLGFQFIDFATHHAEELQRNEAELLEMLASGKAVPHIGARFPLDDAAAALRYVADGRAIGKVLLDIG